MVGNLVVVEKFVVLVFSFRRLSLGSRKCCEGSSGACFSLNHKSHMLARAHKPCKFQGKLQNYAHKTFIVVLLCCYQCLVYHLYSSSCSIKLRALR